VSSSLKGLTEEQLKAGDGIKILSEKFNGFAEKDAAGFSGSTTRLKVSLGELSEEFGSLIIKNKDFQSFILNFGQAINGLTQLVKNATPAFNAVTNSIAVLFGKVDDAAQAKEQISAIDEQIKQLRATLAAENEGEKSILERIFGGADEAAIQGRIEGLLTQKKVLEDSITQIEKDSQEARKQNFSADADARLERSKRLYQEQITLDKQITAQKEKDAKVQKEIQLSVLSSTSQFLTASSALFKNNSREQKAISIAVATIDTYVAANKAMATLAPPASFAAAAAAIATGLANVAKITSVGSFQNGGFIGGSSYSGDRLTANVNSGEAVLNASQQRNFMELANNGVAGNNASIDLLAEIRNLRSAIMMQPVVVEVSGREIARVVRDERAAGFAI